MLHPRSSSSETSSQESQAPYETPELFDLQRLFWLRGGSDNHVDQVWPNLYLGDAWAARSKATLQSLNITHILNAADGPYSINTGARYYRDLQIEYYGVEAFDDPSFDLSIFFYDAANFIHKALNTPGGKVFVHCAMGISRSASLVLAFLMIHEDMTLVDALKTVNSQREICPNTGFLSQLRNLDIKLNEERKAQQRSYNFKVTTEKHGTHRTGSLSSPSNTPTLVLSFRMAWVSLHKDDLLRPKLRSASSLPSQKQSNYQTPPLEELQRLLWAHKPSTGHVNEVWPNLFVGDVYTARDKDQLQQMGISNIVNAAAGRFHINTGAKFYRDLPVDYYGIEADDDPNFDLSIYFYPVARQSIGSLRNGDQPISNSCACLLNDL
ncbi:dual specificity protein phosphatase 13 [Alligator mississippiensis]|uniref:Dual specificity protein phosphatase 13 n=1 Tax=Alligator mississippiensis TaxID=8496 RepID=A0A151MT12_ALLMI|nr:dual specificity protein phosphatase 13 [Alligator mississippiensis]